MHVEPVIALNVLETLGPVVRRRCVGKRVAAGNVVANGVERHGYGVDFRPVEVTYPDAARSIGPFVGRMLVGPGGVPAVLSNHFENSVGANKAVRIDRAAAFARVAWQIVGINAAASLDLLEVDVNLLVEPDLRAADAGTQCGSAHNTIGCGRE